MFRHKYCIYKWHSKKSNHFYIGHAHDFERRKQYHLNKVKAGTEKLYVHMRATGVDSWEMKIIDNFYACNRAEAEEVEQTHIDRLKPSLNMCAATRTILSVAE